MSAHAIEVRGLDRSFGTTRAVAGLSFTVRPGELYGLVGPDGAGKTTTLRVIAGLVAAQGGEVAVMGHALASAKASKRTLTAEAAAVRELVGYMPQQASLYGDLSIDENILFFGRLFGLAREEIARRRDELLAVTQLARFADRRADALSGGMYKKLALSCALLHRPSVLLLDEPSNGVDPVSRRELWDLLYRFVDAGMAVLLTTPYMDEAARCHRVGLIDGGRLLAEGAPDALTRSFPHPTRVIKPNARLDRAAAERALAEAPELLALSPQGADLRAVVRAGALDAFEARVASLGLGLEPTRPDFEDVYLGLLATHAAPTREAA